jgi:hypothetical protein
MCGAWQPGGLREERSRKIPGFASPPLDGFAVFADRTGDNRSGCRRLTTTMRGVTVAANRTKVLFVALGNRVLALTADQPASTTRFGRKTGEAGSTSASPLRTLPCVSRDSIEVGSSGRAK